MATKSTGAGGAHAPPAPSRARGPTPLDPRCEDLAGAANRLDDDRILIEATAKQEVSSNVAGVNQAAAETGAAASQVLQATGELATQADLLRREVEGFLAEVRAA